MDSNIRNASGIVSTQSVTNADGLTVNGVIVPVFKTIAVPLIVTDLSKSIYIATEAVQLVAVRCVYGVVTASGTLTIEKLTGTTAPGGGTVVLTGTLDLTTTANTVLSGTLTGTTANLQLAAGNRFGIVLGGVLTGLVGGMVELDLKRI